MELFIIVVSSFALGWWLAMKYMTRVLTHILETIGVSESQMVRAAKDLGLEVDEDAIEDDNTVWFKIEKHGNTLYSYRIETEEFIAQSEDPQGLVDRMAEVFPKGTLFRITDEDGAEYIRHLGDVK